MAECSEPSESVETAIAELSKLDCGNVIPVTKQITVPDCFNPEVSHTCRYIDDLCPIKSSTNVVNLEELAGHDTDCVADFVSNSERLDSSIVDTQPGELASDASLFYNSSNNSEVVSSAHPIPEVEPTVELLEHMIISQEVNGTQRDLSVNTSECTDLTNSGTSTSQELQNNTDSIYVDKLPSPSDDTSSICKGTLAFEVDFGSADKNTNSPVLEMPTKKAKNSLQEAFLHFRKKRQDEIRQERRRRDAILEANADPVRMARMREKIIAQAKRYFGVPYARKYWQPNSPEYNSSIFLDCCGLVRQVIRDLQDDLGFRLGPWNQSYMFDTLPVTLTKRQMKPGDLVFMTGDYVNPKKKKQRHNMLHVEIWLGEGNKTIGSRWNNGKVSVFDSYKFDPKSFNNEQYIFKSIDTWLMGICHSYCSKHPWRLRNIKPSAKSIFNPEDDPVEDERASPDSDDEDAAKDGKSPQEEGSDGDGNGGGGGLDDPLLEVEDVSLDVATPAVTPGSEPPGSGARKNKKSSPRAAKGSSKRMPSPRKFRASLKQRLQVSGTGRKDSSTSNGSQDKLGKTEVYKHVSRASSFSCSTRPASKNEPPMPLRETLLSRGGGVTLTMDQYATVLLVQSPESLGNNKGRRRENQVGDLTLLKEARRQRTPTVVTSVDRSRCDENEDFTSQTPKGSIVRDAGGDAHNYVPNRLPSRASAVKTFSAWRTSKERETQARYKKQLAEHYGRGPTMEAWISPVRSPRPQKTCSSQSPSPLAVVGSHRSDSNTNKFTTGSTSSLQSSDTNLLFRTNTNFFNTANPAGCDANGKGIRGSDGDPVVSKSKHLGGKKEKVAWRLSARVSPEKGCGQRNEILDAEKVRQKLQFIHEASENDFNDSSIESDDSIVESDDYVALGSSRNAKSLDISSCLMIQQSPRIANTGTEKDARRNVRCYGESKDTPRGLVQKGRGRGGSHSRGTGRAHDRGNSSVHYGSGDRSRVVIGRSNRVYMSTSFLQSALGQPSESATASFDGGKNITLDRHSNAASTLPPVDDGSVVVFAGTASDVSSLRCESADHNKRESKASIISHNSEHNRDQPDAVCPEEIIQQSSTDNVRFGPSFLQNIHCHASSLPAEDRHLDGNDSNEKCFEHMCVTHNSSCSLGDENKISKVNTNYNVPYDLINACGVEVTDNDDGEICNTSFTSDLSYEDMFDTPLHLTKEKPIQGKCHFSEVVDASGDMKAKAEHCYNLDHQPDDAGEEANVGFTNGDGGDGCISKNQLAGNHGKDIDNQLDLSEHLGHMDTDDELDCVQRLTTSHTVGYQRMSTIKSLVTMKQHDVADGEVDGYNLNSRAAVVGDLYGPLAGSQCANPAWEWLYSFPAGVHTLSTSQAGFNANNNSSSFHPADACVLPERCGDGGTSLFARLGDREETYREGSRVLMTGHGEDKMSQFFNRQINQTSDSLSLPQLKAPPATPAVPRQVQDKMSDEGRVFINTEDTLIPAITSDDRRWLHQKGFSESVSYQDSSPNFLASWVLNQRPKNADDDELDYEGRFCFEEEDIVDDDDGEDFDDKDVDSGGGQNRKHIAGRRGRASAVSSLTGSGFDFIRESSSSIASHSTIVPVRAAHKFREKASYMSSDTNLARVPKQLDQLMTTGDSSEVFKPLEENNNQYEESYIKRNLNNNSGNISISSSSSSRSSGYINILHSSSRQTAKLQISSPQWDTHADTLVSSNIHERATSDCPCCVPISAMLGVDSTRGGVDDCRGTAMVRGDGNRSTLLDVDCSPVPEGFLDCPWSRGTPTWEKGASPKGHVGKQSTGADGGGGDKGERDKQAAPSESVEGGGDDGLKAGSKAGGGAGGAGGVGGGAGGGSRRPSRNSKLPQCCLPNNMQPTFFIGGGNGTALVEAPLLALGWKRITDKNDERYRLKWVESKSRINYVAFREGEQLVNHIPNCKLLTNKMGLLCSLQEYERVTLLTKGRTPRMKMTDFVPQTYKLDERVDREKFLNEYADGETWICKPTSLNQGKGIFLLRSREEINNLLSEREAKKQVNSVSRQPLMRIVQRYIHKPLLLDNRKFDIRSYMLIASTVPYLLLFHQGYVRLSCHKYDQDDTNLSTHLTNQFVQKKDPSYKDIKDDTAWTMDKFNDYINDHVAKEKNLEQDWVYGSLTKQMQRISLHCFNSVKHKLQCKIGYFDLYGLDFMVDDDMKVWLIEINANPALHTNCTALKEAIPPVVETGLYLAVECFDKSRKGQPLLPLNSQGNFNVLYCGASPTAVAPRQIRSVSPFKDAGEWASRPAGRIRSKRRKRRTPRHVTISVVVEGSSRSSTVQTVTSINQTLLEL